MTIHSSSQLDLPADKSMLDAVTFVAGLVSKPSDIDPQLDKVREITAARTSKQFTTADRKVLEEVYAYIEEYLVTRETLRSFTQDSIRQRVYDYLHGKRAARLGKQLFAIWAIATASAVAASLLPESILNLTVKTTLAVTLFFVAIHLGAAWMFWEGLRNFKDKMRHAYLPICSGIVLVGVTMLQVPFALAIGQYDSLWFRYGTSGLFITIAAMLIYVGVRRLAKLSGTNSRLLSIKVTASLCLGASIMMSILPRPASDVPNLIMVLSFFILTSGAVLAFVSARIVGATRQSLSLIYKRPMTWLAAAMIVSGLIFVQFALLQVVATPNNMYEKQGFATLPLVISAFVLLKASTSFRRIDTTLVRAT